MTSTARQRQEGFSRVRGVCIRTLRIWSRLVALDPSTDLAKNGLAELERVLRPDPAWLKPADVERWIAAHARRFSVNERQEAALRSFLTIEAEARMGRRLRDP